MSKPYLVVLLTSNMSEAGVRSYQSTVQAEKSFSLQASRDFADRESLISALESILPAGSSAEGAMTHLEPVATSGDELPCGQYHGLRLLTDDEAAVFGWIKNEKL